MSLIGLLLAMAIGMAVYYGVSTKWSFHDLASHTPGGWLGFGVLVVLAIVWVFVQFFWRRGDEPDEVDEMGESDETGPRIYRG